MTKGKNKSLIHRKIRQATRAINRDIGTHVSHHKMVHSKWGSGVKARDFAKRDDD